MYAEDEPQYKVFIGAKKNFVYPPDSSVQSKLLYAFTSNLR
jgi:hypothetical protein